MLVVAAAHFPALSGYFQADDFIWLQHGHWQDAWQAWVGNWGLGSAYRPLTRLSYVVDARVFGSRAWGWHAVNLSLHAANAVLVGAVARRLGWRWGDAAAAACVFAAFPMDWESVDWISGRTGLLCVLFGLLAVRAWLDVVMRDGRWSAHGVVAVSGWQVLALLCYEPAAVLPGVLGVSGAMLVGKGRATWAAVWRTVAVACGVDGAFWIARGRLLGSFGMYTDAAAPHPLWGVARNLAAMGMHTLHFMQAPVLLAVLGLLGWGLARRRGAVAACLLTCGVLYAPFALVDGFTERFAYAASVPMAAALVISACALPLGARWRSALSVGLVVIFTAESNVQARGMRQAGDRVRVMLAGVRAVSGLGGNLVFAGVPDNFRHFYLLRGAFEQAAAAEAPRAEMVASVERVCADPALRARASGGRAHVFVYNAATGGFDAAPAAPLCIAKKKDGVLLHPTPP